MQVDQVGFYNTANPEIQVVIAREQEKYLCVYRKYKPTGQHIHVRSFHTEWNPNAHEMALWFADFIAKAEKPSFLINK